MRGTTFILTVFLVLFGLSAADGRLVTLFETSEPLVDSLTKRNWVDIGIDRFDFFRGPAALRLEVTRDDIVNGQAYRERIPGWKYSVVRDPVGYNEVRWVMFVWKKIGYGGIMVQFANNGVWGRRYVAGENLARYPAVEIAASAPGEWQVVVRDLYKDFGEFTLTGIGFTPFRGIGLYDSMYLARTESDLLAILDDSGTVVSVRSPSRIDEGDYFTVSVEISNVDDLAGFEMEISFDPDVLRATQVDEGSFLSDRGATYWLNPDRDNKTGRITEIACLRCGPGGVSGDGVLLTVVFDADEMGQSDISIENLGLVDSQLRYIAARIVDVCVLVAEFPPWDVDKSGRVDVVDFIIVGQYYGQFVGYDMDPNPDVTGDGWVNVQDLVQVGRHYGEAYLEAAPVRAEHSVPARYISDLVRMHEWVSNSPSPDRTTILVLEGLIKGARPVALTTWGGCKRE